MFVLFVEMRVKPGAQAALEKTYTEIFRPPSLARKAFAV